jgi:hypothetical protein
MTSLWAIAILGIAGLPAPARASQATQSTSCAMDVVEVLGGQGEWLTLPQQGPAWRPSPEVVGERFVPYVTDGAWVVRDGALVFSSRWSWGDVVFNSGRWTLNADEGWLWLPDQRCVEVTPAAVASNGEPMPLPPSLPTIKVRTIKHPLGIQFAYPYGQEVGRVFPAGVQVPMPTWTMPVSAVPGAPASTVVFPVRRSSR